MNTFDYVRPATISEAIAAAAEPGAAYLAAGTNLLDLMKGGITRPNRLVDVTRLPGLDRIERLPDGGIRIGALVRNADLAHDPDFARSYPAVAEALLSGASAQLRNAATVGGNLLQRTRCGYFYDVASACNKREPGAGCDALHGENRLHAVLGWSEACIATHPSDFCVPLVALDAVVEIEGRAGRREIAVEALHRLPGDTPERESALEPGDLIVALRLPGEARHVLGACPLSEGPRAHLLRLRRRVGRRGPADRRTARSWRRGSRSAASPPNRGAPARRRRSWPAPVPATPPSAARRRRRSLMRNRPETTNSRSSSRGGSSGAL